MDEQQRRAAHLLRTVLLSTTTLGVAATAHATGGGELPTGLGLLALGSLTVAVSSAAARARARVLVLVPLLALLQLVLHHGFSILAAPPAGTSLPGVMTHHGTTALAGAATGSVAHTTHGVGAPMLAAHAAAVLLTAVALVASERAAGFALAVWSWLLPALTDVFRPSTPARARTTPTGPVRTTALARLVRTAAPRRGPPVRLPLPA
ncbi:hypothetical protein [Oerskovia flava]|uniref:hypothetical protein n=1 Tax=Oerskovia flava TaxID=2986422 RepID=UPI00223EFE45|nr:hypothetical protein [Oerskovia sp. JB1-3-2]